MAAAGSTAARQPARASLAGASELHQVTIVRLINGNGIIADAVPGTRIQLAGRPLDGLPKAAPQGRAERERASSTAEPQYILILEDASTGVTPQCAATTLVNML